jgi:hypothetical protein
MNEAQGAGGGGRLGCDNKGKKGNLMAAVVPFPSRIQPTKGTASTPCKAAGMTRLRKAIHQLCANLDHQLEEITKFRQEVANLDEAFARLQVSFTRFDHEVGRIDLNPLRAKSRRLANVMDNYLINAGKKP